MSVTDKAGNADIKYTRNGSFMTKDGHIVDTDGNRLMGEGGEIIIPGYGRFSCGCYRRIPDGIMLTLLIAILRIMIIFLNQGYNF